MDNLFLVQSREIPLLDERLFLQTGGDELWFGALDGDTVALHVRGSAESIRLLAREIMTHHTSAAVTQCNA
jgi:hypothetical protein